MKKSDLIVTEALEVIYYVMQKRHDQFLTFGEIISLAKKEVLGFEMRYSPIYNGILQQRLSKMKGVFRLFNFDTWTWMFTDKNVPTSWTWPNALVEDTLNWARSEEARALDLSNLNRPEVLHTVQIVIEDKIPVLKYCFPLSITIEYLGTESWYWEVPLTGKPKLKAIF